MESEIDKVVKNFGYFLISFGIFPFILEFYLYHFQNISIIGMVRSSFVMAYFIIVGVVISIMSSMINNRPIFESLTIIDINQISPEDQQNFLRYKLYKINREILQSSLPNNEIDFLLQLYNKARFWHINSNIDECWRIITLIDIRLYKEFPTTASRSE